MKKELKDFDFKNKKVIIRCDFNVPIDNGIVIDDFRIRESLKTINYVVRKSGKVIILSHMGRVKNEEDKEKYTLKPVAERLSELLNKKVIFIDKTKGKEVENIINNLKNREIVLLENTRFEDKETKNDKKLAKYWASLGDIFINDAFGVSHRAHSSNLVANYLPSGIGFLIKKELKYLSKLENPKHPYVVILGGSKVSDKIGVIDNLAKKADYVLIGGAMAFTFLKAAGFKTGKSLTEKECISYAAKLLSKYEEKIVLPIDVVAAKSVDETPNLRFINEIKEDEMGLDIGDGTIKIFKHYISEAKTIFLNGPLGYFENDNFKKGTDKILDAISKTKAISIIGGGDSANASKNYKDKITYISTGGGASLKLIEEKKLKGIELINDR